jgi:hypothetical protein
MKSSNMVARLIRESCILCVAAVSLEFYVDILLSISLPSISLKLREKMASLSARMVQYLKGKESSWHTLMNVMSSWKWYLFLTITVHKSSS